MEQTDCLQDGDAFGLRWRAVIFLFDSMLMHFLPCAHGFVSAIAPDGCDLTFFLCSAI